MRRIEHEQDCARAQQSAPVLDAGWRSAETAPRDGRMILANTGYPWSVVAVWSEYQQEWAVTELQGNVCEGKNDPGWVTEWERELLAWRPLPGADETVEALVDALEYALPYLEACVPRPRNGIRADGSVDVNCVDRARSALAAYRGSAIGEVGYE